MGTGAQASSGEGPVGILARLGVEGTSRYSPKRGKRSVADNPGLRCCRDQWQAVLWPELGQWPVANSAGYI